MVKEIFYTLQGEGFHAGRPAVFLRFAGCNLWSGREEDRMTAKCRFCDTDFIGGERFIDPGDIVRKVEASWPVKDAPNRFVVVTGGEPLLQLDHALVKALQQAGFYVAIETNGTLPLPVTVDWVCVSPKMGTELRLTRGDELKFVYPQSGNLDDPDELRLRMSFKHYFIQPKDGPEYQRDLQRSIDFCLRHPQWRLSLQTHKLIGIP